MSFFLMVFKLRVVATVDPEISLFPFNFSYDGSTRVQRRET
jgi:hypothetical protein